MSKLKSFITLVIVLLVSLPVAVLVTILIFPFWNWFETVTGIESFGHSGPADWCYLFDYAIIVIISVYALFRIDKRAKKSTKII